MHSLSTRRLTTITALMTLILLLWDLTALDLAMARWFGGPGGFALRDQWFLTQVMHDGARHAAWGLLLCLSLGVWWPWGALRRIDFRRRLQLAATCLLAVSTVSVLKSLSHTSCPWDLTEFGGFAHYASHWRLLFGADGGSGRCFPAGHASTGFTFIGGYFAFRHTAPARARGWMLGAVLAGLALGLTQQIRGAHFMSHTLWTGWLCWCVAWAVDAASNWMVRAAPLTAPASARAGRLWR